jgi:hypothetical protein
MNQPSTQTPKRKTARKAERKASEQQKCTLMLSPDTSIKLTVAAHLRGLDRSELVNELLNDALRHVVISIRGQSNGSATHAGDVSTLASQVA